MRRSALQFAIIAVTCAAVSAPADARPRFFRIVGALATAPVAIIAGAAYGRARHHRERSARAGLRLATGGGRYPAASTWRGPGWTGPLFWPQASVDLFDYVFGQAGGARNT